MTNAPRPLDRLAVLLMAILSFSWGFNQIAAKIAFADFGPVTQSALRSAIGSLVLIGYAWRAKPEVFRRDGTLLARARLSACCSRPNSSRSSSRCRSRRRRARSSFCSRRRFSSRSARCCSCRRSGPRPRQWLGMALAFSASRRASTARSRARRLAGDLLALLAGARLGRDDRRHQDDPTARRRPDQGAALPDRRVGADHAALAAYGVGERWPSHLSLGARR